MKIEHIRKKQEFARVLEKGAKKRGKAISLYTLADPEAKNPRIGVIIPKSLAPLAVQRNYMRRLLYSAFRDKALFGAAAGTLIVARLTRKTKAEKKRALARAIMEDLKGLLLKEGKACSERQ